MSSIYLIQIEPEDDDNYVDDQYYTSLTTAQKVASALLLDVLADSGMAQADVIWHGNYEGRIDGVPILARIKTLTEGKTS